MKPVGRKLPTTPAHSKAKHRAALLLLLRQLAPQGCADVDSQRPPRDNLLTVLDI